MDGTCAKIGTTEENRVLTIPERLKLVIELRVPIKRRFPALEAQTGINENTWRTWWTRGSVPSAALVEAVGKAWPEFALWLCIGFTDSDHGHIAPSGELCDVKIEAPQERIDRLTALLSTRLPAAAHALIKKEIEQLSTAEQ